MKRLFYLIFAFLFAGGIQINAQQMIVYASNGEETKFEESDYTQCKVTFSEGKMLFHVGGAVKNTFDIKSIQRISFYGLQSAASGVTEGETIQYFPEAEMFAVNAHPGSLVAVYNLNGTEALSFVHTIASSTVSIAHLPAGVYVIVVGNETLKFVKQ
jgi:hypothetical protein